tara:strand:+ start:4036 stop:4371 length:336 start_codon:yes stop_codon:yes gene_type:complete
MIIYHVYEDFANSDGGDHCVQKFVRSYKECMEIIHKTDKRTKLIKHTQAWVEKWTFEVQRHQNYEGTGQANDIERDYEAYWHIEKLNLKLDKQSICNALNTWAHTDECYHS